MHQPLRFLARLASFLTLAAAAASAPVWAATTTYTDSASFLAAIAPGAFNNTFTGVEDSATSYSYSGGGFGYTVAAPGDVYLSGSFIGNNTDNDTLTITFTTGNVTALGGNFFITDIGNSFQASAVTLTLSDGTTTTFTPSDETTAFRGFVSTAAIVSLMMSAPGANLFNSLDNLTVGVAVPITLPEPGTWALVALALGGLSLVRRQRAS